MFYLIVADCAFFGRRSERGVGRLSPVSIRLVSLARLADISSRFHECVVNGNVFRAVRLNIIVLSVLFASWCRLRRATLAEYHVASETRHAMTTKFVLSFLGLCQIYRCSWRVVQITIRIVSGDVRASGSRHFLAIWEEVLRY